MLKNFYKKIESWQEIIDKCLLNKTAPIRESATAAFAELCQNYYNTPQRRTANAEIIRFYLKGADSDIEEHIRMGYISALGVLPLFMVVPHLDAILESLVKHSLTPYQAIMEGEALKEKETHNTQNWSEARRDSVKALSNLVKTVGYDKDSKGSIKNDI